jgi:protein-disulfide isomerase
LRSIRSLLILAAAALLAAGCVSRNVESIDSDEAATLPSPPAPLTAEERAAEAPAGPGFTGVVRLAEDIVSAPEGVLYIIVRVAGREGGPPLAVKRLPVDLPAEFSVTSADSMIPGTPLVDAMDVTVRVDQDGDAWTDEEGDLEGTVGAVALGDAIEVVLTRSAISPQ